MTSFIGLFLHLDKHLLAVASSYGPWVYPILFCIIFCETGLVVTPVLPGDSLLFAAGALGGMGLLRPGLLMALLSVAAIAGDTVNYWIGSAVGASAVEGRLRFFKVRKEHLDKTHAFYEKYGGKTIILARFVPIVRTFAPFVAGLGAMSYRRFLAYNVAGGLLWIALFVGGGYWFGNLPAVKRNFSMVILAIIVVSVLPIVYETLAARRAAPEPRA